MTNTVSGPFNKIAITNGTTPANKTWGDNAQLQAGIALASLNPDVIASGFILNGCAATRHNSYASTVLADSPVHYFRLNESSGATAYDLGSALQHLTYNASPTLGVASLLTGDSDTCVTFASASSQYANTTSTTGLPTGAGNISIECWIKNTTNPGATQFILDIGDRGTATHHLVLAITSTGTIQLGNGTTTITSAAVTANVRHHLVGTYDGTNLRLYTDGALAAGPTAATNALSYTGNTMTVASQSGATPGSYYNGTVDEVAIYSSVLNATQVTNHYTNGTTATTTVDIASGKAYLVESDGTLTRCTVVSTTQTTSSTSTTYHLYLQPDGTWYWSTSNSPAANSLAIADIATDGSGNAVTFTDKRTLSISLLSGASGPMLAPKAGTLTDKVVADTLFHQWTLCTIPVTGLYRITAQFYLAAGSSRAILLSTSFTQGHSGSVTSRSFVSTNAAGALLWDGGAGDVAAAGDAAASTHTLYLLGGSTLYIRFQDASWSSGNDLVNAICERLT